MKEIEGEANKQRGRERDCARDRAREGERMRERGREGKRDRERDRDTYTCTEVQQCLDFSFKTNSPKHHNGVSYL